MTHRRYYRLRYRLPCNQAQRKAGQLEAPDRSDREGKSKTYTIMGKDQALQLSQCE